MGIAELKNRLTTGKPVILTMLVQHGTLQANARYLLAYDGSSRACDLQGYQGALGQHFLGRYDSPDVAAGRVNLWGVPTSMDDSAGEVVLTHGADGQQQLLARVDEAADTAYLEQAAEKLDLDLQNDQFLTHAAAGTQDLVAYVEGQGGARYLWTRAAADTLDAVARCLPFIYTKERWDRCTAVLTGLYGYLQAQVADRPFGVETDYPGMYGVAHEAQTSATVLRGLFSLWQATPDPGFLDLFANVSARFMGDADRLIQWDQLNPNGKLQVAWVIARRYELGLEGEERVRAAEHFLLSPVLREQVTGRGHWTHGVPRGFGGWTHGLRKNLPASADAAFPGGHEQRMGYHGMIVRGLAEWLRLLRRKGIAGEFPFFNDNCPFNLQAATSWVFSLSKADGRIMDMWHDPRVDGVQSYYGTQTGLETMYQVLRTLGAEAWADPYPLTFAEDYVSHPGIGELSANQLLTAVEASRRCAHDVFLGAGPFVYAAALPWYYPELRPTLF